MVEKHLVRFQADAVHVHVLLFYLFIEVHFCGYLHRIHVADLSINAAGMDQVEFGPAQNDCEDLFIWLARNRALLVRCTCLASSAVGLFTLCIASRCSVSFARKHNVTCIFAATVSFPSFSQLYKSVISFACFGVPFTSVCC